MGRHEKKKDKQVRNTLILTGVVVLVAIILSLAWLIPPTSAMDEYRAARILLDDPSKGPVIAWFQWALTPIHLRIVEFGLAPDWWS